MKQFFKSFLTASLLLAPAILADCGSCDTSCSTSCETSCETSCNTSCNTGCNNTCSTTSIFRPRSQGADTARELVGWQDYIHRYECGQYKTVALAFQYERSFNGNKIANTLFGTDTLNFVGSGVANRVNTGTAGCCNLVADYFGLPTLTNASLKLNPLIQNYIFDIEAFWGFESCGFDGLYFRMHVPLVWSRWSLFGKNNGCGQNTSSGIAAYNQPFANGYMSTQNLAASGAATVANELTYAYPNTSLQSALSGHKFGFMKEDWQYGKFSFCGLNKFGVADVDLILGWDFWNRECGHFGLYAQSVLPTGRKQHGTYIFEPMVGDRHFKLGGGLSFHYDLWECNDHKLALWIEGNVLHLFNNTQVRSFDFALSTTDLNSGCNNLSRYMLLKEFNADGTAQGAFINAINFTTRKVRINIPVEGDASLKFAYKYCNWTADLGYNVYGKSSERGCIKGSPCLFNVDGRVFGFKGTSNLYTIPTTAGAAQTVSTVTQSTATMCAAGVADLVSPVTFTTATNNLNTSSGLARAQLTHKLFGFLNYSWKDCECTPFLGIGASGEWAQKLHCVTSGLSQWSVLLKGGMAF